MVGIHVAMRSDDQIDLYNTLKILSISPLVAWGHSATLVLYGARTASTKKLQKMNLVPSG